MKDSDTELGFVVTGNRSDFFRFILKPNLDIKKWEYVYVESSSGQIVGRIEELSSISDLISEGRDYRSVEAFVNSGISEHRSICSVRVTGTILPDGETSKGNRSMIRIGEVVHRASSEILSKLFGMENENSVILGTLPDYDSVEIGIRIKGLRRHVAIMAQTGAGKSNIAAVLMEELLRKGANMVVLDPHADYVHIKSDPELGLFTKIFRTDRSTGRYGRETSVLAENFTVRFQDLDEEDLFDIMRIEEEWTTLREIVRKIMRGMQGKKGFEDFMESYEKLNPQDKGKISGRISLLKAVSRIFSSNGTEISEFLNPGQLSILDLSGLDQEIMSYFCLRIIDQIYERKVSNQYEYPVIIFIEEAHNFVGSTMKSRLSDLIKKIASEGRKFGVFLVVITQRPNKIDQDVLSQCNSQIILRITNPMDQRAIAESCESVSQSILDDLPSLNTGEAVLVGEFTKFPVIVKVRKRKTREGGGDIDMDELIRRSKEARDIMFDSSKVKNRLKGLS